MFGQVVWKVGRQSLPKNRESASGFQVNLLTPSVRRGIFPRQLNSLYGALGTAPCVVRAVHFLPISGELESVREITSLRLLHLDVPAAELFSSLEQDH